MRDLQRDVQLLSESTGTPPEARAEPPFVVIIGLPGTGKSHFARKLRERLPAVVLESDALRKVLFSRPRYSPRESAYLFKVCHLLVEGLLRRGIAVILDATNLSERHRERLYQLADTTGARLILVRVRAPEPLVRQRLAKRQASTDRVDASDADWEVYLKMKAEVERIARRHFVVDTSRDIDPVIDKIVREARK